MMATTRLTTSLAAILRAASSTAGAPFAEALQPPYPPSPVIKSLTWHWDTLKHAAPGSDLWPVTWGAWTTVAYYNDWGQMGKEGHGLTCDLPPKWMSADGQTMWCLFSAYGDGAKQGIKAHDCFNLVKVTVEPR